MTNKFRELHSVNSNSYQVKYYRLRNVKYDKLNRMCLSLRHRAIKFEYFFFFSKELLANSDYFVIFHLNVEIFI